MLPQIIILLYTYLKFYPVVVKLSAVFFKEINLEFKLKSPTNHTSDKGSLYEVDFYGEGNQSWTHWVLFDSALLPNRETHLTLRGCGKFTTKNLSVDEGEKVWR